MSTPHPDAGSPAAPSPETAGDTEPPNPADPETAASADARADDPPATTPVARAVDVADASRRRRAPRYGRFAVVGFLLGAVIAAVLTQFPQGDTPLAQYDPRDVFLILLLGLGTVGILAGLTWALISDRRSLRRRR